VSRSIVQVTLQRGAAHATMCLLRCTGIEMHRIELHRIEMYRIEMHRI
jgi:hypothetical protein